MSCTLTGLRSHGMHRRPRLARSVVWPILPAALTAAAVAIPIGWAGPVSPPSAPRACSGPVLPSGDVTLNGGREFVCTDGAWIPVTGYGYGLAAQITPAGEAKACATVTSYRAHRSHRSAVVAISAARHADSEMRADITRYVRTGHGWSRVYGDCNPDA